MTIKANRIVKAFEAIPLTIFLVYIRFVDAKNLQNWRSTFIICGLLSFLTVILFLYKKMLFNRLLLGTNMYFLCGGIAFITHQWWFVEIYNSLQASGILVWIIIVGIVSIFLNPRGFIGVQSPDKKSVKKFSLYLLFFTLCALIVSFGFRENRILSEILPFIALYGIQSIFKIQFTKNSRETIT